MGFGLGSIMGHDKTLAVLGEDHKLPRFWERNTEKDIPTELEHLLEGVGAYSGSGTWYTQRTNDGIAIVLIHEKGKRKYILASEFWVGDE